jgi:hypothetical protein
VTGLIYPTFDPGTQATDYWDDLSKAMDWIRQKVGPSNVLKAAQFWNVANSNPVPALFWGQIPGIKYPESYKIKCPYCFIELELTEDFFQDLMKDLTAKTPVSCGHQIRASILRDRISRIRKPVS